MSDLPPSGVDPASLPVATRVGAIILAYFERRKREEATDVAILNYLHGLARDEGGLGPCSECGAQVPNFLHPARAGEMVCGACWSGREQREATTRQVRAILWRARVYQQPAHETLEAIRAACKPGPAEHKDLRDEAERTG